MDFLFPRTANAARPSVGNVIGLLGLQIGFSLLMLILVFGIEYLIGFRLEHGSSVAAVGSAYWYGKLSEERVPHSLDRNSFSFWLSLFANSIMTIIGVGIGCALVVLQTPAGASFDARALLIASLISLSFIFPLFVGVTWLGLWQGRRFAAKQRRAHDEKSRPQVMPNIQGT